MVQNFKRWMIKPHVSNDICISENAYVCTCVWDWGEKFTSVIKIRTFKN